jgi:hypothetical protein
MPPKRSPGWNANWLSGEERLAADERAVPGIAAALDDADRNLRAAELALAKATADQAGVEAEWRVADAELSAAQARLARLDGEARGRPSWRQLAREGDPVAALAGPSGPRRAAAANSLQPAPRWKASRRARPSCRPRAMPPDPLSPQRAPNSPGSSASTRPWCATARRGQAGSGQAWPAPVAIDRARRAGI